MDTLQFRRQTVLSALNMAMYHSGPPTKMQVAFVDSVYDPFVMEELPCSHLPPVALVKENMTKIKQIIKGELEEVHVGKFLLCRVVAWVSLTEHTCKFVVDDLEGKYAMTVLLINPGATVSKGEPMKFDFHKFVHTLSIGAIIALMHPFIYADKNLRIRNPNELVILGKHHPLLADGTISFRAPLTGNKPSSTYDNLEAKDAGVKYFAAKNYPMALECFTLALNRSEDPEGKARQYSNRAMTHLCLGNPEKALEDAERGMEFESKNQKLVYRKAKSLFLLKRYSDCAEFLKSLETDFIDNAELNALLSNAQTAARESQTGKYDLDKMAEEALKNPNLEGHGDYFDERFDIRKVKDFGRAIFAKEAIPADTLLLCSKAFLFWPKPGPMACQMCEMSDEHEHTEIEPEPWMEVATIASALISSNPAKKKEFYQMSGGEEEEDEDEEEIEKIEKDEDDNPCYWQRSTIEEMCKENLFFSTNNPDKKKYMGLWIRPSFIKQSNKKKQINCTRRFIGSFMLVQTSKDLKPGDQLTFDDSDSLKDF